MNAHTHGAIRGTLVDFVLGDALPGGAKDQLQGGRFGNAAHGWHMYHTLVFTRTLAPHVDTSNNHTALCARGREP